MAAIREKATRNEPGSPTSGLTQLFMVEGMMIIFLALAFYLLLALLSYSPFDPGWSSTGENEVVNNLVGSSGAWLADVLYLMIGNLAFMIPLLLLYKAVTLFRERQVPAIFNWSVFSLRAAGLLMTLFSACMLASIHFASELQESAGGLLGGSLASLALPALDMVGTTLLCLTLFFLGMTLGLGISWLKVVDQVGAWSLHFFAQFSEAWQRWQEKRREEEETQELINQRKDNFEHFVEKESKRPPIEIKPVREAPREPSRRVQREKIREKQGKLFETATTVGDLPPITLLNEWEE
ncbi:MAG: DNA translocase FtsK 4TM domain-containing protein, partial [Pseudomonadota bacterium]